MNGALWYLIRTSARNRLVRQVRRLRTPRYALAFALGLLYLWFFLIRSGSGQQAMNATATGLLLAIFSVLILAYLGWSWAFGTDRSVLAFTRSEVALLFPAPITRRSLILYKLARSQLGILFSAVIWSVLLNRGGDFASSVMRGTGLWFGLTTLSLHRLGIGLQRAGLAEHGGSGARRSLPALAGFVGAAALLAYAFWQQRTLLQDAPDLRETIRAVVAVLESPPAQWILLPITIAFGPITERELLPWLMAVVQAALLLALHVWWVLGSDAAFEEAAAEASERQARRIAELRARQGGAAPVDRKAVRRTIPLRGTGIPATAIVWKNLLWVMRTGQVRSIVLPPTLMLAAAVLLGDRSDTAAAIIAVLSLGWVGLLFLFGPMSMRNDLRSDLLHLPMLKSLPIAGRDVVLAQILSGALVLWFQQVLMLAPLFVALLIAPGASPVPPDALLAALLGLPPMLLALNAANFSLHNGLALLLPGWVKLGERGPSGVEATGQMMLTSVVMLLGLALLLVPPALGAGLGYLAAGGALGTQVLVGLVAAAAVLAAETWFVVRALGGAFERVEPLQVG